MNLKRIRVVRAWPHQGQLTVIGSDLPFPAPVADRLVRLGYASEVSSEVVPGTEPAKAIPPAPKVVIRRGCCGGSWSKK